MLKYLLTLLVVFSMSCSLYTSAKGGDVHEYMKGSDARERIRNSLTLFPGYFDYALSNTGSAQDRAYYKFEFILDLVVADMVHIEDSAWYKTSDVDHCMENMYYLSMYIETALAPSVCKLKPRSPI